MNPDSLIHVESLATLGGASFAVILVGNVFQYVFNWNPRWLGLIVAFLLAGLGVALVPQRQWVDWVVAIIRGFQIYATAVGIASITGNEKYEPVVERGPVGAKRRRTFWVQWF
jgi:hypothetical protein